MNNVSTNGSLSWNELTRVPRHDVDLKKYSLLPGDVVFNNTNSTELVGKSAYFSGYDEPVVFSNHFTRLRATETECDSAYLAFWLHNLWNAKVFEEICNKWIGQSAVKPDRLFKLEIPLPPLPKQKRIAAILTERLAAVERARKASLARLEAARALPAAYLREVFESEEAKGWPIRKVGDIAQVSGGIQKTPARNPVKHFRPYLTVRNVQRGYFDLSQVEQFEISEAELKRYRLEDKDILIVEGNGSPSHIGRNALFEADGQEWIHQNHIIRVRIDQNECLPDFASAYLNSGGGKAQMLEKAETTSGLYTLSTSKVSALELPVPSLSLQERSISALKTHREEIAQLSNVAAEEKAAIELLPASLLRQAFSGAL